MCFKFNNGSSVLVVCFKFVLDITSFSCIYLILKVNSKTEFVHICLIVNFLLVNTSFDLITISDSINKFLKNLFRFLEGFVWVGYFRWALLMCKNPGILCGKEHTHLKIIICSLITSNPNYCYGLHLLCLYLIFYLESRIQEDHTQLQQDGRRSS